jgi:hypothetical protein
MPSLEISGIDKDIAQMLLIIVIASFSVIAVSIG